MRGGRRLPAVSPKGAEGRASGESPQLHIFDRSKSGFYPISGQAKRRALLSRHRFTGLSVDTHRRAALMRFTMHRISFKATLLASALLFQSGSMMTMAYADPAATLPAANPLAAESTLPYGAPVFDKIKDTDYQPAIQAGITQHLA